MSSRRQQREDVQRLREFVQQWTEQHNWEDNGIWTMRAIAALLERQDELEQRIEMLERRG
jgi:hypothetical protein